LPLDIKGVDVNLTPITETIHVTFKQFDNEQFKCCHKVGKLSFSRYRLLSFKRIVIIILQQLQRSLSRELLDFVSALQKEGADLTSISKVAFCKARKKLRYTAFVELNKTFTNAHYQNCEKYWVWKNYRLLAADGSTVEVPNSKEVQREWGVHQYRKDGKAICMARTLTIYDPLNRLTVAAEIDSYDTSESELLWEQLPSISPLEGHQDLLIFDRYFASYLLIFYLNSRNNEFCFRMKKDWWLICESFYTSGESSRVISIGLPQKDKKKAKELGIEQCTIKVRLARIELEGGETEILLTSLCDQQSTTVADLKELYAYRWPIETSYFMLKHKVEIENFSGKSINVIKQDYHAKILIMNFAVAIVNPIDDLLKAKPKNKYKHQVNFTNALGRLKTAVVDWFVCSNVAKSLQEIISYLFKTTEPVRKGRKFNRHKQPKRRFHMTIKRV
jgi:hypothetical protein